MTTVGRIEMRSRHVDRFNHDEDAPGYDREVLDESDPIRAGYGELLDWVVEQAGVQPESRVLELGSGTGNLTLRLPPCARIVCVDVSSAMAEIARGKLSDRPEVEGWQGDLLEYFAENRERFDRVVSSYAVHHLTRDEKGRLFSEITGALSPGGRAVFGDLAFESAEARARAIRELRSAGQDELVETIEDEYFWLLDDCIRRLRDLGFEVETRRFSQLSWGVSARAGA